MSQQNINVEKVVSAVQGVLISLIKDAPITIEFIQNNAEKLFFLYPDLSEEEKKEVINELIQRNSIWIGKATCIANERPMPWVHDLPTKQMIYWNRYRAYTNAFLPQKVINELDRSTDEVLDLLMPPSMDGLWSRRGLVVGHVQSGKTSHYTGLICKAADAGYRIIIVLAGIHNNLRAQTQIRLEEGFLGIRTPSDITQISKEATPLDRIGVSQYYYDKAIIPDYMTTRAENGDFNKNKLCSGISPTQHRPCLFVVKKNGNVLRSLYRWLSQNLLTTTMDIDGKPRKLVMEMPLLIIDDEADNASIDIRKGSIDTQGNPDTLHDPSAINKNIRKLLHLFGKSAYVGYTATPFANIFIHSRNTTEDNGDDLFPSAFIINLPSSSDYMGPTRFFGTLANDDENTEPPLRRLIHYIPPTENWLPDRHQISYRLPKSPMHVPPSLQKAIQSFVLSTIARQLRGTGNAHCSMLIHVTRFTKIQKQVYNSVRAYLTLLQGRLENTLYREETFAEFQTLWESDFQPTTNALLQVASDEFIPEDQGIKPLPPWSQIKERIVEMLDELRRNVTCINGSSKDILSYAEHPEGVHTIVIGGDKLSRGLTLEGLSVSYFMRASRMYDTLMQMGRWFGYRKGYLDLCRLYLTEPLADAFACITDASEELREEFDIAVQRNLTPQEYGLKVAKYPSLMITSPLKMRAAQEVRLSFSGHVLETITFFREPDRLQANQDAMKQLLKELGPSSVTDVHWDRGTTQQVWKGSSLWKNVPVGKVLAFLDRFQTQPNSQHVNSGLIAEFIRKMNNSDGGQEGELLKWNVALIGGQTKNAPVELLPGLQVSPISRICRAHITDRYAIGRLLSPRDETIDIDTDAWQAALKISKHEWKQDPGRARKEPETPTGPVIRRLRGFGCTHNTPPGNLPVISPGNPLLLLYLVNVHKEEETHIPPDDPSRQIAAFGISFPYSGNDKADVSYCVNNVYLEEDWFDDFEGYDNETEDEDDN